MAKITRRKNSRQSKPLSVADIALLANASRQAASYDFPLEWREITKNYSVPELIERVQASQPKRGRGRPGTSNKFAILDAAAIAKAKKGTYTQIAATFKLKPKQLTDLVQCNRSYFDHRFQEALRNIPRFSRSTTK